ncbi:MAG: M48 family metalloprotease [Deltaproteobacteria bacterium]|nr:M48 family metalloprotease [Deltaproteobacteria bacterium]
MQFIRKAFLFCFVLIFIVNILVPKGALCITIQEEEEMSREVMKVIMKHYELINDPLIVNYINQMGQKIVSALPPQPFNYHFYVIKNDEYNAFATPAGHVFINSGLLEAMENEEELAGILSHEIAHVVCRHISQKIERAEKIGIATLAGVAAGILLGVGGSMAAANALTIGSTAAGQSLELSYSREDEFQADQIGLVCLTKAGYHGEGLLSMLKKLWSRRWFGPAQIPTYLSTHPATEERMANIDTWLEQNKKTEAQIDNYNFSKVHVRLVAVYGDESFALRKFEEEVKNHPEDPLAHYGYGLILARTGARKNAIGHLKTALKKNALDPYMLKDLGQIYFLDGQYREALNVLKSAARVSSNDPEIFFYLGRTQMEFGRLHEAAVTFEKLIAKKYNNPQVFYSLGETYYKKGRLDDYHYYLGLFYKEKNDFKNASFHLKRALENMSDPDKREKIEKMLKQISGKNRSS